MHFQYFWGSYQVLEDGIPWKAVSSQGNIRYLHVFSSWNSLNSIDLDAFSKKSVSKCDFQDFWSSYQVWEVEMFRKACFTSVYDRYLHVILSRIPLISLISTHFFRKKCVEMRFPRIRVTLPGLGSSNVQKSCFARVYIGILHVVWFRKLHEHLLKQRRFWWEFHFCPAGRSRFHFFRRVRRNWG